MLFIITCVTWQRSKRCWKLILCLHVTCKAALFQVLPVCTFTVFSALLCKILYRFKRCSLDSFVYFYYMHTALYSPYPSNSLKWRAGFGSHGSEQPGSVLSMYHWWSGRGVSWGWGMAAELQLLFQWPEKLGQICRGQQEGLGVRILLHCGNCFLHMWV